MARARFLNTDHYGSATLAATNEVTALPVESSQNTDRRFVYRSTTGTIEIDIDIDFGSVKAVTAVALANTTIFTGGGIELYERGDAGSAGSATLVSTLAATDADSLVGFVFSSTQSHRHWQIKFTNPSSNSGYCELGYVFLGTYSELSVNVTAPFRSIMRDQSSVRRSPSGGRSTTVQPIITSSQWNIDNAPEADRVIIDNLFRAHGVRTPFFCVLDTALAWTARLLYFDADISIDFADVAARYNISMSVEEAPG